MKAQIRGPIRFVLIAIGIIIILYAGGLQLRNDDLNLLTVYSTRSVTHSQDNIIMVYDIPANSIITEDHQFAWFINHDGNSKINGEDRRGETQASCFIFDKGSPASFYTDTVSNFNMKCSDRDSDTIQCTHTYSINPNEVQDYYSRNGGDYPKARCTYNLKYTNDPPAPVVTTTPSGGTTTTPPPATCAQESKYEFDSCEVDSVTGNTGIAIYDEVVYNYNKECDRTVTRDKVYRHVDIIKCPVQEFEEVVQVCTPGQKQCVNEDAAICSDDGTELIVTPCDFTCHSDVGECAAFNYQVDFNLVVRDFVLLGASIVGDLT